jgi:hypothetical protein
MAADEGPMSAEPAFAAGWYRDPDDPARFRWYNGSEFTEQTRAAGPGLQPVVPTAAELHADDSAWTMWPMRLDREYPTFSAERIAADDAREARWWKRRPVYIVALGLLAIALGPVLVILVPMVLLVAAFLWFLGRGGTRKAREALQAWGTYLGFVDEGGRLMIGDKAPPLPVGHDRDALRPLIAAGMKIRHAGGRFRGTPWKAGQGTTVQSIQGRQEYRHDVGSMTVVTVPLVAEVAERYAGLAGEWPREHRKFQLREWDEFDGAHDIRGTLRFTASHDQRNDVGHDLMAKSSEEWARGMSGWVVMGDQLVVWCYGDLLVDIGSEEARAAKGKRPDRPAAAEERLVRLLDVARGLQYLLYGERIR